jgi:molybdenum-dependent DNA-binding transcriptional regulator ModE
MIQMELRHISYLIAVAEEGSFSHAAERRLHTAQPSLSRLIRDLELEVGVKLVERKARCADGGGPSVPELRAAGTTADRGGR